MLSHWTIKLLHVVFVFSLGAVTLRLFYASLTSDRVRRPSPSKRAELLLRVNRNGSPYLNLPLRKSHYLIGRGPECDILLKGQGIPLNVGEIYLKDGEYFLKDGRGSEGRLSPDQGFKLYDYSVTVENM
jgi:hypothetical protein